MCPQATPRRSAGRRCGSRRIVTCLALVALLLLCASAVPRLRRMRLDGCVAGGGGGTLLRGGSGVQSLDECLLGGGAGKREKLFLFIGETILLSDGPLD